MLSKHCVIATMSEAWWKTITLLCSSQ